MILLITENTALPPGNCGDVSTMAFAPPILILPDGREGNKNMSLGFVCASPFGTFLGADMRVTNTQPSGERSYIDNCVKWMTITSPTGYNYHLCICGWYGMDGDYSEPFRCVNSVLGVDVSNLPYAIERELKSLLPPDQHTDFLLLMGNSICSIFRVSQDNPLFIKTQRVSLELGDSPMVCIGSEWATKLAFNKEFELRSVREYHNISSREAFAEELVQWFGSISKQGEDIADQTVSAKCQIGYVSTKSRTNSVVWQTLRSS